MSGKICSKFSSPSWSIFVKNSKLITAVFDYKNLHNLSTYNLSQYFDHRHVHFVTSLVTRPHKHQIILTTLRGLRNSLRNLIFF